VLWFRFICRRKTESSTTSGSYERPRRTSTRKQLDTGTEYAVLSHCWGLIPFTTLTQERLSCFMQDGIADEILPANFLDAIWMCRQLQFAICALTHSASYSHGFDTYASSARLIPIVALRQCGLVEGILVRLIKPLLYLTDYLSPSKNSSSSNRLMASTQGLEKRTFGMKSS
jgi:hypothetical protein